MIHYESETSKKAQDLVVLYRVELVEFYCLVESVESEKIIGVDIFLTRIEAIL
jgi:hypothetical protein